MPKIKLIFICIFLVSVTAAAQRDSTAASGTVLDSITRQPIKFATLVIENNIARALKSMLSTDSGLFTLPKLPAGNYRLHISAVGYRGKTMTLQVVDTTTPLQTGMILLAAQNKTLANVTVTARPPLVKQEIDRLTFDVQADPENKVNNVLEMLRKLPLVTVDAEENVQLKGSSNFRILVNGKTSALLSGNIKDVLRSMPASTIERIEVITIPPAKYEAEGLAGIINIITAKKIDDGYKGTINSYYRLPITAPGAGASFSLKKGKWAINFSGGYNTYRGPEQTGTNYRETSGSFPSVLQVGNRQVFNGKYGYAGMEMSFAPDSLQLITAELNVSGGGRSFTNWQLSDLAGAQQQLLQHFMAENNDDNKARSYAGGINYQLGFKQHKNRLLTFSYKYFANNLRQQNAIVITEPFNYPVPNYQQFNKSYFTEQTFQADYVHPLNANAVLEAGVKGILRNNESDFRYLSQDSATGKYNELPAFSNMFSNTQSIAGVYTSFQYGNGNWSIKAGARLEATYVHANFTSTGTAAMQQYFNIIPSISIQRKYANNASITAGFTQRIQRPGINQLNPFIDRSNPNFESTGNPGLTPVISNNAEINFSTVRKITFVGGISLSFVNNNIQQGVYYEPVSKITRSRFDNIGKERWLAGNISITWPVNERCNISINGSIGYAWYSGMVDGIMITNAGTRGNIRTSFSYSFKKGWRISKNLNYYSPFLSLQGHSSYYLNPSLSVSKELKKFTFSLATINYFSTWFHYDQETRGTNFIQYRRNNYLNRSIVASINFRFGKLTKQPEKTKRGINNDDLSGN